MFDEEAYKREAEEIEKLKESLSPDEFSKRFPIHSDMLSHHLQVKLLQDDVPPEIMIMHNLCSKYGDRIIELIKEFPEILERREIHKLDITLSLFYYEAKEELSKLK